MGWLWFRDFSQIQFTNDDGPSLPRRQRVRMNNLSARDTGEEVVIDAAGVGGVPEASLGASGGVAVKDVKLTNGFEEPLDGPVDRFSWLGNSGTLDGYRVKAGSGGNWQRAIDRNRIDVRKFGARANGSTSCNSALDDLATWAMSPTGCGAANGVDNHVSIFFPAGPKAYRLTDPWRPPGDNHVVVQVFGEGGRGDLYAHGASEYTDNDRWTGTVIQADPGVDAFWLHNDGTVLDPGRAYHILDIRDLMVIATPLGGLGTCIKMDKTPTAPGEQSGRVKLTNVKLAGGVIGLDLLSYQHCAYYDCSFQGCDTGIRGGDRMDNGCSAQYFYSPRIEGCNTAVELYSALSFMMFGSTVQGCYTGLRVPPRAGPSYSIAANRQTAFIGGHWENVVDNYIDVDSVVGHCGISFREIHFGNASQPVTTLYGDGWLFDKCPAVNLIDFVLQAGQTVQFRECFPKSVSGSGAAYSVDCSERKKLSVYPSFSGSKTLDFNIDGDDVQIEAFGAVTLNVPINYPPRHLLTIRINQSNGGGHAVTFSGAEWKAESLYSSTGNANGTICTITVVRRTDGYTWVDAFSGYTAI
jgi:hypothetical protein